ncbi:RnfABCDGE type electron transport complex subunit B [Clostridium tarantellae]|uniref:Ion-translocating oxidoreductase complex subunit B n=1 Tax=Clostridium tarantellae TaxID=39493 RepID=A0A6I1MKY9_9CLOT|nr:RnfABCDGE type electron transport complex subunit B [Clostridium tarantellae]MPQ44176.1 RnfABCDGE type electron transport complex subunit B [Clostridium tarantellae]
MGITSILYSIGILGVLGLVFGILLGIASKVFEVKVDERILKIKEILPGANCGGCGYPGCDAYATAIIDDGADATSCTVGGVIVAKKIGNILGIKIKDVEKKTAFISCNGNCNKRKEFPKYNEIKDCNLAKENIEKTNKTCIYGCLGLGTCIKVCKFDALYIEDGIVKVKYEKCINCGACIKVCPMGLIKSVDISKKIRVACSSKDFGKAVKEKCSVGCIGCKLCEKNCMEGAIKVIDNIAKIDYKKCTNCGICFIKCPTKAIIKE